MPSERGLILANIGWSDTYSGERVRSRHGYVEEKGTGAEAFNFKPTPDGLFYGYLRQAAPKGLDASIRWTIVFVSKPEGDAGRLRIVGWYEDALLDAYAERPEYLIDPTFPRINKQSRERFVYCAVAPTAMLVPVERRTEFLPSGHPMKRVGVYYLTGRKMAGTAQQNALRRRIEQSVVDSLARLRTVTRKIDAGEGAVSDLEPLLDPELRKKVDAEAMRVATRHLKNLGFETKDVSKEPLSYDIHATNAENVLKVEVKGTHRSRQGFFISRNEYELRHDPDWRLLMVTEALENPRPEMFTVSELNDRFAINIHSYVAVARRQNLQGS